MAVAALLIHQCVAATPTKHLFLDNEQISEHQGVEIRLHRPTEHQNSFALTYDEPWENLRSFGYNSVVDNGTHVLIYYMLKSTWLLSPAECAAATPAACVEGWFTNAFTCVAISPDGSPSSFVKPVLNLVEINGSKQNNCIWPPGAHLAARHETGTVFIDERPGAPGVPGVPADSRYKMIATWGDRPGVSNGTFTFASSDGLRFRPLSMKPASGVSGTQHVGFWDPNIKKYVGFVAIISKLSPCFLQIHLRYLRVDTTIARCLRLRTCRYVDYRRMYSDFTTHNPWNWNSTCCPRRPGAVKRH
jgi:hypothetical protein